VLAKQGSVDGVRKPFDAEEMQMADSDQRFWVGLLAAAAVLTVVKVRGISNGLPDRYPELYEIAG